MARTPKFPFKKTASGWQVDVPASVTENGRRQRHFFKTRDEAKDHAQTLREKFLEHGGQAAAIRPSLAEAAIAAEAILKPWGASLVEAAQFFHAEKTRQAASKPAETATADWLLSCDGLRDRTLAGYKQTAKRINEAFGKRPVASITSEALQAAVCPLGRSGSAAAGHYRNARAFWKWAAKKGWCENSVFSRLEAPRVDRDGEISILAPGEAEALIKTAQSHYPQAVAYYALQLFAGIRSEELRKLEGKHVSAQGIDIPAAVAKKGRRRHIVPNAALKAWLTAFPFAVCPNWRRVDMACRCLAGWAVESELVAERVASGQLETPPKANRGAWPQNVLRHSHASYAVAAGAKLEDLLFEFGHAGNPMVLRQHYLGRATKAAALAYFAIRPEGQEAAAGHQIEAVENPAA